jgi:HTH-type transcriptional repressor of NAD biosynthesis genes
MRRGLIIGKFLPPHAGHRLLIEFARKRCDELHVLVGALSSEPIPGPLRHAWMREAFAPDPGIIIDYTDEELPTAATSSREVSKVWAAWLKTRYPDVDAVFSSEDYGPYLAEYMGIVHEAFDPPRSLAPVSATMIRERPLAHWDMILPEARGYFLKRVCLYGPESTGKSTMAGILARRYGTVFVPEVARALIDERGLSEALMPTILEAHARAIVEAGRRAERFLFVDSDYLTTLFYSRLFYGREPQVPAAVLSANAFDLYLFFDIDAPYVEDPQRFSRDSRAEHKKALLDMLEERALPYEIIRGSWAEREEACAMALESRWPIEPA